MEAENYTVNTIADAVELLALFESQIKASRALYKQVLQGEPPMTEDQQLSVLNAIERNGIRLALQKKRVWDAVLAGVLPYTLK